MRFPVPVAPTRARHTYSLTVAMLIGIAAAGCSDSPTGPRPLPVTVSGFLTNRSGEPIPANARVVVLWSGDDGSGDYAYIFGEGSVDRATNRFTVTFDREPPAEAVLSGRLGVGLVMLTIDPNLGEGRVPDTYDYESSVIGVTEKHAVVFLDVDPNTFGDAWPAAFRRGFNVGREVDLPGTDLDDIAPARLNSMELIVDDLASIDVINWS